MGDWKTIRVPKDVYEDAKKRKEQHGVTWGQYVNPHAWHSVFGEPKSTPEEQTVALEVDGEVIREAIRDELSSITINVDMADFNLPEGSDVSPDDVERIVRDQIEKSVHERARSI